MLCHVLFSESLRLWAAAIGMRLGTIKRAITKKMITIGRKHDAVAEVVLKLCGVFGLEPDENGEFLGSQTPFPPPVQSSSSS